MVSSPWADMDPPQITKDKDNVDTSLINEAKPSRKRSLDSSIGPVDSRHLSAATALGRQRITYQESDDDTIVTDDGMNMPVHPVSERINSRYSHISEEEIGMVNIYTFCI